ncbi:hypothetical protein QBC37DRAFT_181594 [Rhypophila decipiens]|uniref:Rhodopsin domain-containing protein n=1 Tax=Rhypophila decipiens TaxID=261697 RepID=A0AAN6Y859_9PEZI|nr:hypothetical protein QBC37DRAFT_181594 [Rhypophila decipiens]
MRTPPPEVRASWPTPNYIDPVTRGPSLIIVEIVGLTAALLCLGLRLYVRAFLMRNTGLDDWIMIVAMVFSVALTIAACLAYKMYGWDRHVYDLLPAQMIQGRQISLAIQAIFVLASSLAKISIVVSYLRLALVNSWFRKLCHGSIWLIILSNGSMFVVLWTQCIPISDYWNIFKLNSNCIPESPPLLTQAIMTVFTDFLVWALPLWTLYQAKLPLNQRIALIILFSFGLFVCIAGCVRTYWIHFIIDKTYDPTWQGFHLWIWTAIEVHLGVICGCVPWLKSLINYKKGSSDPTELSHGYVKSGGTATIGGTGAARGPKSGSGGGHSKSRSRHDGIDSKWLGDASSLEGDEIDMDSFTGGKRTSSTHPIAPNLTNDTSK